MRKRVGRLALRRDRANGGGVGCSDDQWSAVERDLAGQAGRMPRVDVFGSSLARRALDGNDRPSLETDSRRVAIQKQDAPAL